jgi:hypothetical protein
MVKQLIKWLVPHGLVEARERRILERNRTAYHMERKARIKTALSSANSNGSLNPLDHLALISFLESREIPRVHLVEGSIPPESLQYLNEKITDSFTSGDALFGLHIGNFVGVSLSYLTGVLHKINKQSLVVAIDPNLTHRGVANPQSHVAALLSACGLQENVLLVAGYSGTKSISNDGAVFVGYDPGKQYSEEHGCQNCIKSLGKLADGAFHVALMDGNHEAEYLRDEIAQVTTLLRPGGFIILDDVDSNWQELKDVFHSLTEFGFEIVGTDGRVGVARLLGPAGASEQKVRF